MTRIMISAIVTLFVILSAQAQQTGNFEGAIKFDISYSGEKAEMLNSMGPSAYTYMIRDDKMRVKMEGGMSSAMGGDVIVHGNDNDTYMLKDKENKALKIQQDDKHKDGEVDVRELDESKKILGYECQRYKVTMSSSKGKLVQFMWVTSDINVDIESSASSSAANRLAMEEIEGMPLKINTNLPMGNMEMTMKAKNIDWKKITQSKFAIPDTYSIEKVNPSELRQGGGMY